MKLYHIAAISENRVIAKDGQIPWQISEDLKRFKQITQGHPIIMGHKTFDSIGRPLPGRFNVVLTRRKAIHYDGRALSLEEGAVELDLGATSVAFAGSVEDALKLCADQHEVYVIGGGEIYHQTLKHTDALRLTIVHTEIDKDGACVLYPALDQTQWRLSFVEAGEQYSFVDYVRVYNDEQAVWCESPVYSSRRTI